MRKVSREAAVFTLVVLAVAVAASAGARWVTLGERVVNDRVEKDVIKVGVDEGEFTALKVTVLKRPVHFIDMKVHFVNGGVQDVELKRVIQAGASTRVIDLTGDDRFISKVEFRYEAESPRRGKRAQIRLLGRR